jgi:hypothetical protein
VYSEATGAYARHLPGWMHCRRGRVSCRSDMLLQPGGTFDGPCPCLARTGLKQDSVSYSHCYLCRGILNGISASAEHLSMLKYSAKVSRAQAAPCNVRCFTISFAIQACNPIGSKGCYGGCSHALLVVHVLEMRCIIQPVLACDLCSKATIIPGNLSTCTDVCSR